ALTRQFSVLSDLLAFFSTTAMNSLPSGAHALGCPFWKTRAGFSPVTASHFQTSFSRMNNIVRPSGETRTGESGTENPDLLRSRVQLPVFGSMAIALSEKCFSSFVVRRPAL